MTRVQWKRRWRDKIPPSPRRASPAGLRRSPLHCRRWRRSRCGDIPLAEPKRLLVSPVDESHGVRNKKYLHHQTHKTLHQSSSILEETIPCALFGRKERNQCRSYLPWFTFPGPQSEEGHLAPRVENCKVIHASELHLNTSTEFKQLSLLLFQ